MGRVSRIGMLCALSASMLASCSYAPPSRIPNDTIRELRADYVRTTPDTPYVEEVLRGDVVVGMSYRDVFASWGFPDGRRRDEALDTERWSYVFVDEGSEDRVWFDLLFESNRLMKWERSRDVASSHALYHDLAPLAPPAPGVHAGSVVPVR